MRIGDLEPERLIPAANPDDHAVRGKLHDRRAHSACEPAERAERILRARQDHDVRVREIARPEGVREVDARFGGKGGKIGRVGEKRKCDDGDT